MPKTINAHNHQFGGNVGWVLTLILVAGSSFLIGSSFRQKQAGVTSAATIIPAPSNTSPSSTISDISSSLQNTPVFDPTAVATDVSSVVPSATGIVNLNTGTETELESLPQIGPTKAKAIIDYRTTNGPFVTIEDIEKVKGIGPKTFESLKSKITV